MGLGLKRKAREVASRAFGVVVFPQHEQFWWPERSYLRRLLTLLDVDCVFDVGANRGQYGRLLRGIGFEGLIISFEPNPAAFADLSRDADDNWICMQCGLGSTAGELPFNVMKDDVFSSFRKPSDAPDYAEENSIVSTITVPVKRLDAAMDEVGRKINRPFLKIDTQGFDLEVVEGAGSRITEFRGLSSEVAIKNLYAGSPTFEQSRSAIEAKKFVPSGMFTVNPYRTLSVIEMNAYFVREDLVGLDPN